jgi:hypothetical protein
VIESNVASEDAEAFPSLAIPSRELGCLPRMTTVDSSEEIMVTRVLRDGGRKIALLMRWRRFAAIVGAANDARYPRNRDRVLGFVKKRYTESKSLRAFSRERASSNAHSRS